MKKIHLAKSNDTTPNFSSQK